MSRTRHLAVLAATLGLAVTLTACGAQPDPSSEPDAEATATVADDAAHNDADTTFAQMMIVHHQGAVEMAELAAEKASTDEVRALGERIAAAQGPEIDMMTSWLEAWGEEVPSDSDMAPMDDSGMEGMEMGGTDQDAVMGELSALTGADFDRRFLELMIEHHRGAIEMAEQHRGEGENPEAVTLSGQIIDAQTAEITEMTNLLQGL